MLVMRSYLIASELPDSLVICSGSTLLDGEDAETAIGTDVISALNSGFPPAALVFGDPLKL